MSSENANTQTEEMDMYRAAMIADGAMEPADEEEARAAWQYLIDTGIAWQLQGRIGRVAMDLISSGYCEAPEAA